MVKMTENKKLGILFICLGLGTLIEMTCIINFSNPDWLSFVVEILAILASLTIFSIGFKLFLWEVWKPKGVK